MVTTDMSDGYEHIPCDAGLVDDGWDKARIRHHLARQGVIRYQINGALGGTVVRWLTEADDGNLQHGGRRTENQSLAEVDK